VIATIGVSIIRLKTDWFARGFSDTSLGKRMQGVLQQFSTGYNMSHGKRFLGWNGVCLTLAVLFVVSDPLSAQQPQLLQPQPQPQPAVQLGAPKSKFQTKYSFEMRDVPWNKVIEWITEKTDVPFIGSIMPTGTFTFIPPVSDMGPRKYTLPEIIDILNEAMQAQKYLLIRRTASYTIWPADVKLDPQLVPRATSIEELKTERGKTEIVSMILPVKSLVAIDIAPDVKKMLGPFGEVIPLDAPNALYLQDKVGTLLEALSLIEVMESFKETNQQSFTHQCKYVYAEEAAALLKLYLGDPETVKVQSGSSTNTITRKYQIVANNATRLILMSGPADKIAMAKDFMQKIDKGNHEVGGETYIQSVTLPTANAEEIAPQLQKLFEKSPGVQITALGKGTLVIQADQESHLRIQQLIRGGGEPIATYTMETIFLNIWEAPKAADMLTSMYGDQTKGGPYIGTDPTRNALFIKGSEQLVKDVIKTVEAMEGTALGGSAAGKMRIITLDQGSASVLAEALERLLPQMRQNPVRVIQPGTQMANPLGSPPAYQPQPQQQPREQPQRAVPGKQNTTQFNPAPANGSPNTNQVAYGQPLMIPGGGNPLVDPQNQGGPKELPGRPDQPITITAFGNKLMVTSDDPKALALVQEMVRLITQTQAGEGDFEVIRLRYADATEAAQVLDEAFNGKPKSSGKGGSSKGGPSGGGGINPFSLFQQFAGGGATPPADPTAERIRVVADPGTNSLLVRAKPLDMLTIRKLLEKAIDSNVLDTEALPRPWLIGPLEYADAEEIADLIETVFRENTNKKTSTGRGGDNDRPSFFPFGSRSSSGGSQNIGKISLSVAADTRTNTLIVNCPKLMYEDIKLLVDRLEQASKDSTETVKVIPIRDVDPLLVQQAIELFQGTKGKGSTSSSNGSRPSFGGFTPGGSSGGGGFSPGSTGGGGFGGRPSGSSFGKRSKEDRGPDFFVPAVKDDHSVFFDPQQNQTSDHQPQQIAAAQEQPQPNFQQPNFGQPRFQPQLQPQPMGSDEIIRGPRSTVEAEALRELGLLVVRAKSKADLDAILKIIDYIQIESKRSEIDIQLVPLRKGDPTQITNYLSRLFSQVTLGTSSTSIIIGQGAGPGQQPQTTTAVPTPSGSLVLIPVPHLQAILVAAPKSRMNFIMKEIARFDVEHDPRAFPVPFVLQRAPASRVALTLLNFYAQRYPDPITNQNQVRITYDDNTNTVFVQAAPADLAEIKSLIERIDSPTVGPVSELRIVRLNAAVALELADLLTRAISEGVVFPTGGGGLQGQQGLGGLGQQQPGGVQQPGGLGQQPGLGGLGQQGLGGLGQQRVGTAGIVTKTSGLKFFTTDPTGNQKVVKSGILEDVRINPDIRTNSLVIAAPKEAMELVLALIRDLDVPPTARSEINVFTLKRSDAATVAGQLQQLFLGTAVQQQQPAGGLQGGLQGGGLPGGAAGGIRPLQPTLTGQPPQGAPLIDVRITVDDRTNSIIVAGSQNDLMVIRAIIDRLDNAEIERRVTEVYWLRNAIAADVALALNDFYTQLFGLNTTAPQFNLYQQFLTQVIVVPEPITNKLLISATPEKYSEVMRLIQQLDLLPPQVVITAMVAEVQFDDLDEFGVELGLQSPIFFERSILPGGTLVNNSAAIPGFNFNTLDPLGQSTLAAPGRVGLQGLGNYGLGRISQNAGVGGFVFSAASESVNVLVRALRTQGRLDLLSRPQVTTADNQAARILIGQSFPFIQNSVVTAGVTGIPAVTNTVSYRDIGVQLQVTPKINPDGSIIMRVVPEISSVVQTTIPISENVFAVAFNVQTVETTVIAQDGETVIIGGLVTRRNEKDEAKVPWLGDLPGVGALFRYRQQKKQKGELVVILTPHVVRNRADADRILAEEARRMDWILGDVLKAHGPHGLAPIMPDFIPPAPTGHPMVGSPYALPYPSILPGQPISGTAEPETLPKPVPLPNKETLPFPNGKEQLPLPMGQVVPQSGSVSSARYPVPHQPILMPPELMQNVPLTQPEHKLGHKVYSRDPVVNPGQPASSPPPMSNSGQSFYYQQPAFSPAPNGFSKQPQTGSVPGGYALPAAGQEYPPHQKTGNTFPMATNVTVAPQQQEGSNSTPSNLTVPPQQQGNVAVIPQGRKNNEWLHITP
jgi:general secretion pathway protein D